MKITTRLILSFLMVTILPLAVMGYAGLRVMDRIGTMALDESTESLKRLGEDSIHQQALSVARQVELYLEAHPEMSTVSAKELESNKALAAIAVQPVGKTGYTAVYDSDAVTHFHTNPALIGADLHTLANTLPEFWRIMQASLSGASVDGYYKWKEADGSFRDKYMSCVPVGKTRFRVAATTYIDEFYQPIQNTRAQITDISQDTRRFLFVAMAASVGMVVLVAAFLAAIIVRPLRRVTEGARLFSEGKLGQDIPVGGRDEIGLLATTLNQMAHDLKRKLQEKDQDTRQLNDLNQRLEQQVAEVGRRVMQLQAAAEVAHVAATQLDPDQLMAQVVGLIQERFGFYYVGLFLADADNHFAVLQSGTGQAGRAMKERGHRLEVGGQSIVGWACANKRARIALDVGAEAVHFVNPLLPETHSEMALPLMTGERVLGALDVQSTQVAAFDESDITALQGMADQVAVGLENARLFQQTQVALKQLEAANRLLVRQGWQGHLERPSTTRRSEFGATRFEAEAKSLEVPLELRGQPLGKLTLRRENGRDWTQDEVELIQAIAQQTTLAADNARLVEQTQTALQETEGLFAAARDIAQAAQIQNICQSLANYVNILEQSDRTIVTLVDWPHRQILARIGAGNLEGELDISFDEFESGLGGQAARSGEPVLSLGADDPNESEETRARRERHNIGALFIVPLSIKGQVIGTVSVVNRTNQRKFNQRNVDLAMALAGPAATALENVRLLEATQRRAERERTIRQITTRIRSAGDTQGILEATATELAQTLRVPRAIVRLAIKDGSHQS